MLVATEPKRLNSHQSFPTFPSKSEVGEPVFVARGWLENTITAVMWKRLDGPSPELRVLELVSKTDPLDFHLSFKVPGGFVEDIHFCIRLRGGNKKDCLYWFYALVRRESDGRPAWDWRGWAGQGDGEKLRSQRVAGVTYGFDAAHTLDRLLKALTKPGHVLQKRAHRWELTGPH